ncbi:MAG TPA: ClpX C4-type zinc finger protein, partial [Bacteroidales bacterium]|nr:ClpX C4-type zinc finger protein [Bacteroidales bacterium]
MKSNHCSFCGRAEKDVPLLLHGIDAYICTDCVENAYDIIETVK